jgi:hypothetical protein
MFPLLAHAAPKISEAAELRRQETTDAGRWGRMCPPRIARAGNVRLAPQSDVSRGTALVALANHTAARPKGIGICASRNRPPREAVPRSSRAVIEGKVHTLPVHNFTDAQVERHVSSNKCLHQLSTDALAGGFPFDGRQDEHRVQTGLDAVATESSCD